MEEQIQLKQVKKQYEGSEEPVIENLNLTIRKGSFTILLGPSGCGKSTTLRMIAGLEALSEGELDIEGQDMDGVAPRDRDVAMVFQNYALYPTMNVRDNIEFGLKNAKVPKAEREHRIREVCDMTGLTEYLRRKPGALSGLPAAACGPGPSHGQTSLHLFDGRTSFQFGCQAAQPVAKRFDRAAS